MSFFPTGTAWVSAFSLVKMTFGLTRNIVSLRIGVNRLEPESIPSPPSYSPGIEIAFSLTDGLAPLPLG